MSQQPFNIHTAPFAPVADRSPPPVLRKPYVEPTRPSAFPNASYDQIARREAALRQHEDARGLMYDSFDRGESFIGAQRRLMGILTDMPPGWPPMVDEVDEGAERRSKVAKGRAKGKARLSDQGGISAREDAARLEMMQGGFVVRGGERRIIRVREAYGGDVLPKELEERLNREMEVPERARAKDKEKGKENVRIKQEDAEDDEDTPMPDAPRDEEEEGVRLPLGMQRGLGDGVSQSSPKASKGKKRRER